MANLKEIRSRITSVNSTRQITQAMKMVSAAKLKRAQDRITQMRPYAEKLSEIIGNLSDGLDGELSLYAEQREVKNVLLIPVTSNRGLAGGFNAQVIKGTFKLIDEKYSDKDVTVVGVGKKAMDAFRKTKYHIMGTTLPRRTAEIFDELTFENSAKISERIMNAFKTRQFDEVVIIYNQFKNAATQTVAIEQMLPVVSSNVSENDELTSIDESKLKNDYIFEPNRESIITEMVPRAIKTQFFKALLDSFAGEHGARMTAMHKATDNASDLLKELKLTYNKARQAAITTEILEIVGGAEALKG